MQPSLLCLFLKKNLLLFNYSCMPFFKDTWTKHRGREVGSTIVPFKHSSESPPGTLLPMLVECLRIFHICKSPGPVLEKASKKLLNILENKTLIFFLGNCPGDVQDLLDIHGSYSQNILVWFKHVHCYFWAAYVSTWESLTWI